MNWWVVVVDMWLNSLHECLFMSVCWWDLNGCGCLWSLNEKWGNDDELVLWFDVCCCFEYLFVVYKLVYKFWGRILGQGDQNWGFDVKLKGFPRGKPRTGWPIRV